MTYCYECEDCGGFDRMLPLSACAEPQKCDCGKPAKKVIGKPCFLIPERHKAVNEGDGVRALDKIYAENVYEKAAEETQKTGTSHLGYPVARKSRSDVKNLVGLS